MDDWHQDRWSDDGELAHASEEKRLRYWSHRFAVPVDDLRRTWKLYWTLNGGPPASAPRPSPDA